MRLLMLDACRNNPFAPAVQHTIALKLVDKGFPTSSRPPARHAQQPFTYGSPPGREDFYFARK